MVAQRFEVIPEGALAARGLAPAHPSHLCPRCGDQARAVSTLVYPGFVVRFVCADGHQWSGSFLDLPADVLAGHGALR